MQIYSSLIHYFLLFFFFILFLSNIQTSFSTTIIAPINKDHNTRLYTVQLYLKTPAQLTILLVDLGSSFTWLDCTRNYTSSSYNFLACSTPLCDFAQSGACSNCFQPPSPGCSNNSCAFFPENHVTQDSIIADAILDLLTLLTTIPGKFVLVHDYLFSCAKTSLLKGFPKTATGLAAFGRGNISLPAQLSGAFNAPYVFSLCLPGSHSRSSGVVFFNSAGPYKFSSGSDLSSYLVYTPLILNPIGFTLISYMHSSDEYFIGLTAVEINGKPVSLNKTLLTIDENGSGGTRLSTVTPYTVLETSIFKAFTGLFVKESAALNLTVTKPVKPFGVCYAAKDVITTKVGPAVPTVDLVMHRENVFWRIMGGNSMVRIKRSDADVWCLGFVDGGANPKTSIVIGGYQMEDNLLQFDLVSKRLGFTSSLLAHGTSCSNFNFTRMP